MKLSRMDIATSRDIAMLSAPGFAKSASEMTAAYLPTSELYKIAALMLHATICSIGEKSYDDSDYIEELAEAATRRRKSIPPSIKDTLRAYQDFITLAEGVYFRSGASKLTALEARLLITQECDYVDFSIDETPFDYDYMFNKLNMPCNEFLLSTLPGLITIYETINYSSTGIAPDEGCRNAAVRILSRLLNTHSSLLKFYESDQLDGDKRYNLYCIEWLSNKMAEVATKVHHIIDELMRLYGQRDIDSHYDRVQLMLTLKELDTQFSDNLSSWLGDQLKAAEKSYNAKN